MFLTSPRILFMIGGAAIAPVLLSMFSVILVIVWIIIIIFLRITQKKITPPRFLIWLTNLICLISIVMCLTVFLCQFFLEYTEQFQYELSDLQPEFNADNKDGYKDNN